MYALSPEGQRHSRRKRTDTACDLCRIKKTKCDGKHPCSRCVAENKICVFTKKKKLTENHPPPGYLELLETRVDLLTRSLIKMVTIAEPHLPFVRQMKSRINLKNPNQSPSPLNDAYDTGQPFPINDIVNYLLSDFPLSHGEQASVLVNTEIGSNTSSTAPSQGIWRQSQGKIGDDEDEPLDSKEASELARIRISEGQTGSELTPFFPKYGNSLPKDANKTKISNGNQSTPGISGNDRQFTYSQMAGEHIVSAFAEPTESSPADITTFDMFGAYSRLNTALFNTGAISNTSPSSLSSICNKLDSHYLDNTDSMKSSVPQPSSREENSHEFKNQLPDYSQTSRFSKLNTVIPEPNPINHAPQLMKGLGVAHLDYETNLGMKVPSSRFIDEKTPFMLEDGEKLMDRSFGYFY